MAEKSRLRAILPDKQLPFLLSGYLEKVNKHARLAEVPVGSSPVPLAIIQNGRTLVVGNSDRFGSDADTPQKLSVLDIAKMGHGDAVLGTIRAGMFPRDLRVSSNGRTLFLTNYNSDSLQIIDAQNPPIESN